MKIYLNTHPYSQTSLCSSCNTKAWSQINVINGGTSFTCQAPGHPVLPVLGSVAQNSKWGGGETGTCEKAVLYFCETNEQVNVAERKGKGRRQHMTNNEWGGKQERMLSQKNGKFTAR